MSLVVVAGNDDVLVNQAREQLTWDWSGNIERIDLSDDVARLVDLLVNPSLFDATRRGVVDHLEVEGGLEALEKHLSGSDAEVVACWRGTPRAPAKKRLEKLGQLISASVPVKGEISVRIRASAERHGITLTPEGIATLAERLGTNWGRLESVLAQLGAAGLATPNTAMLITLCGSAGRAPAVWDVTDAIASGARGEALALAARVEPVVLASWIAKETLGMARITEGGWAAERAAKELGIHPFRASKAVAWARRRRDWSLAVALSGRLDIAAKSGDAACYLSALADWMAAVA